MGIFGFDTPSTYRFHHQSVNSRMRLEHWLEHRLRLKSDFDMATILGLPVTDDRVFELVLGGGDISGLWCRY